MTIDNDPNRNDKGQFLPGRSGNPAGKPKGAVTKRAMVDDAILEMLELKEGQSPKDAYLYKFLDTLKESALIPGSLAQKFFAERLIKPDFLDDIDKTLSQIMDRDTDFQRFRIRKLAFGPQLTVLDSHAHNIGLMCGRRAGKSSAIELKNLDKTKEKPGARCLIIGLTIMKCLDIYKANIIKKVDDLGWGYKWEDDFNQIVFQDSGSLIQFGGNSNKTEREKYLGKHWDLITVDEAQSQQSLAFFLSTILMPMLIDTNGTLLMAGTGPRTPGTFWEAFYNDTRPSYLRLNWDLSANPYIYDHENALAKIRSEHKLSETDPLYLREYRGLIAYDLDALVLRMGDDNYFTWEEFDKWIHEQSPADIRFVAGLDFGYTNANAFGVICYSMYSHVKYKVYEHKAYEEDVTDLLVSIQAGIDYIKNDQKFAHAYHRDFLIYADSARPELIKEYNGRHGLPVVPAIKTDALGSIENLRTEVKMRRYKCLRDSIIADEANRTVYKRMDVDGLPTFVTKEIDDDIYHPDMLHADRYALGTYWIDHPINQEFDNPAMRENTGKPWDGLVDKPGMMSRF